MMEFLLNYSLFLLKAMTIVVAIVFSLLGILMVSTARNKEKGKLNIKNINDYYADLKDQLNHETLSKKALKDKVKQEKKIEKEKKKLQEKDLESYRRKIFVLNFDGDIKASSVKNLREEITAIATIASPKDEVLVKINSTGGVVHGYGLAAAQLQRLRTRRIQLTIAIDKAAASGGYMMACVGNTILAAPFAVIGSIGVMAQIPNFHRYLDKHNVDIELLTAGKYKRTLTVLGKNTDKGRKKAQEDIEDVHVLFKNFIKQNRPIVDIEEIATGEYWYGIRALEKQLVDRLITSDDYLLNASNGADIYEISYQAKKAWPERVSEKISSTVQASIDKAISTCLERNTESRYF